MGRFVPFLAVATANCINIPMMRQGEIARGVIVMDKDGHQLGESRVSCFIPSVSAHNTGLYTMYHSCVSFIESCSKGNNSGLFFKDCNGFSGNE